MTTHANSLSAYRALDIGERAAVVLKVYVEASTPLTDREAMQRLGFTDPNAIRPRATELIEAGLLEECGNAMDRDTHKRVRLCRPAGRALFVRPDPIKEARKAICTHIATMEAQGATEADLARAFPAMKVQEIADAVGVCWGHALISKDHAGEVRQGLPVYHVTSAGLRKLGMPATGWCVDQVAVRR